MSGRETFEKLPTPSRPKARLAKLLARREQVQCDLADVSSELIEIQKYLALSGQVTEALDTLSQQLFRRLLQVIEEKLTIALQEVLEQPIELKSEVQWKRNAAAVEFWIQRDGHTEDIMKGQGGSVANILSVGLRMFALRQLPEKEHRKFLVLDEQDCWLQPELVPRLVKIIQEAGRALDFQVLMISHHQRAVFDRYADRVFDLSLSADGEASVRQLDLNRDDD